jgi:hypothetical protein
MPRWKQRFVCLACAHSAWREVVTEPLGAAPQPARLMERGFYCSMCGARRYLVIQVELLAGRWADAFRIGGMRLGPVTFELSAARDAEIMDAHRQERERKRPADAES